MPYKLSQERVSNEPLREAFLRSGKTPSDVAYAMGWLYKGGPNRGADTTGVQRALGLSPSTTVYKGKRTKHFNRTISLEGAKAISRALHLDFDELYEGFIPPQQVDPEAGLCETCDEQLVQPVEDQLCGWCREVQTLEPVAA